ncbi:uncharacterized protein [Procambarus clarkii]|uniref:uncharacterized protein n=1 Tax=Procambarus clarkii TaxID=6728 RepID=UPI0037422D16
MTPSTARDIASLIKITNKTTDVLLGHEYKHAAGDLSRPDIKDRTSQCQDLQVQLLNSLEMEDDRVKNCIESRDEQVLEECIKAQLQLVADHFGLRLRSSRVAEHRIEIMAQLKAREEASKVEPPQVPASVGGNRSDEGSSRGSSSGSGSIKLEIMKMQLEAQLKREEREAQLKREEREAQLEREECEREGQLKREDREAQLKREEREAQLKREEREAQLKREEREAQLQ